MVIGLARHTFGSSHFFGCLIQERGIYPFSSKGNKGLKRWSDLHKITANHGPTAEGGVGAGQLGAAASFSLAQAYVWQTIFRLRTLPCTKIGSHWHSLTLSRQQAWIGTVVPWLLVWEVMYTSFTLVDYRIHRCCPTGIFWQLSFWKKALPSKHCKYDLNCKRKSISELCFEKVISARIVHLRCSHRAVA